MRFKRYSMGCLTHAGLYRYKLIRQRLLSLSSNHLCRSANLLPEKEAPWEDEQPEHAFQEEPRGRNRKRFSFVYRLSNIGTTTDRTSEDRCGDLLHLPTAKTDGH